MVSGALRACGLRVDGTIDCWGRTSVGGPPEGLFTVLDAAPETTCGLRADGAAICWGMAGSTRVRTVLRHQHRDPARLRDTHRRNHRLLGQCGIRPETDPGAVRAVRRHRRRGLPQLRDTHHRNRRMLGRQHARSALRPAREVHGSVGRRPQHVRASQRRNRQVLGRSQARKDRFPRRAVHGNKRPARTMPAGCAPTGPWPAGE